MTSKRTLERRLEKLETDPCPPGDGFYHVQIGGDPDKSGWYAWNAEKGVYENNSGFEIPPADAPESEFEFVIA